MVFKIQTEHKEKRLALQMVEYTGFGNKRDGGIRTGNENLELKNNIQISV